MAVAGVDVVVRLGREADAEACGRICYEAFREIAERHGYPPDFPSVEVATDVLDYLLRHPRFCGFVAERNGQIVGSNFLDERSMISGLGPITVDPAVQDGRIGRQLMAAALDRAREQRAPGVRLLQAAYHTRSLALYEKLGFEVREPIVTFQGASVDEKLPGGYSVRDGTAGDLAACNEVCVLVHGHDRSGEVSDALEQKTLRVVEHDGHVTGYTTGVAFFNHSVGETNNDLRALITTAVEFGGPGFLVPARNHELFRWCLNHELRVVQVMTLMTVGLYNEPAGAYLPSVLY